jgi:hypothetical protein
MTIGGLLVSNDVDVVMCMGVDPGVTTGWAISGLLKLNMAQLGSHEMVKRGMVAVGQVVSKRSVMRSEIEASSELLRIAVAHGVEIIIMEDFRLFPDEAHNPDPAGIAPVRIYSMMEALAWERGLMIDFVYQMPGEKTIITDERLKRWGLWVRGARHARDAVKHLCVYARKMVKED